ncbi:LmbE family N-acetylglucosaminyl deacetylase [Allocatelliglobosispora scoriae]|uniref:LmbE family N-acetylglucosaminyl deacetylase n=1 Tax=Allocatelliglobosispora scoriae TaxID=643052 RepID=A0A841BWN3_9ACTN|nr:PIG-L family deacetylase [Allocatelliglobosispora scoriae]MBB5872085.1 LmbE family N-acetylglucosaminyl deacetylase [Allocatelliglobosispora scoriae]
MRSLALPGIRNLVAIGAHPDDIEIAVGGTLLTLAKTNPGVRVTYALATGSPDRVAEAHSAARAFLPGAELTFVQHELPDSRLPAHWNAVKEFLGEVVSVAGEPDLVLCPARHDAHQDHRLLAELVPTSFRDALALHYEIPKWDGDLGRPHLYVALDNEVARHKVALLHEHFPSQKARDWWDDEVFLGLARLRGMECRSRYAEAFWTTKARLSF